MARKLARRARIRERSRSAVKRRRAHCVGCTAAARAFDTGKSVSGVSLDGSTTRRVGLSSTLAALVVRAAVLRGVVSCVLSAATS